MPRPTARETKSNFISEPLITHTYPLSQIEAAYGLFENKRDGAPWSVNFSYSNSELLVNRYHLWYNKIITDKVVILWKQKT